MNFKKIHLNLRLLISMTVVQIRRNFLKKHIKYKWCCLKSRYQNIFIKYIFFILCIPNSTSIHPYQKYLSCCSMLRCVHTARDLWDHFQYKVYVNSWLRWSRERTFTNKHNVAAALQHKITGKHSNHQQGTKKASILSFETFSLHEIKANWSSLSGMKNKTKHLWLKKKKRKATIKW